jgi:hypothetical protein
MFYIVAGLCTAVSILVIVGISIRNNSNWQSFIKLLFTYYECQFPFDLNCSFPIQTAAASEPGPLLYRLVDGLVELFAID